MDPYLELGVSKTASQEEIKNAYRALAKKFHPDLNPGNKKAEAKFKNINAAYEILGNPETKAKFDRGETAEQMEAEARANSAYGQGGPSYSFYSDDGNFSSSFGGMGADDFFENLFRQANTSKGKARSKRAPMNYPGEDQTFLMEIDLRDAIRGAQKELALPNGKKLQVKIPPGVDTGSKLRFRGQGSPGMGNASAGDLFIELKVRPLKGFTRNGNDIEVEVPVSFIEAIEGAEIPVPTMDGSVSLKIPPGVSTGSRLRIRGKGVIKGEKAGDQFVIVKIVMPKKIDPQLQAAVREWGGKFSFNPRVE